MPELEDRCGSLAWMYAHDPDAYLAEMDRRVVGRLQEILAVEDNWSCGRLVLYDEVQSDNVEDGARLDYLKSILKDEPPAAPLPPPPRFERKGRGSKRKGRRWMGR